MRFLREDEASKTMHLFEGASEGKGISKRALKNWVVNVIFILQFDFFCARNFVIEIYLCTFNASVSFLDEMFMLSCFLGSRHFSQDLLLIQNVISPIGVAIDESETVWTCSFFFPRSLHSGNGGRWHCPSMIQKQL